jgi:anti-sigma factor RsiW
MTSHLTPDQFMEALDQVPNEVVAAHLASCDVCRAELDAAQAGLADLRADAANDVPEPSPFFWSQFSTRVGRATGELPLSSPAPSRRWTYFAIAAAATVVLMAGSVALSNRDVPAETPLPSVAERGPVEFDEVALLFDEVAVDEAEVLALPAVTTWALMDELTSDERVAFVRLIELEMEGLQ